MQARAIPLEQVIDDVVNMGFSRHEVSQHVTMCHALDIS